MDNDTLYLAYSDGAYKWIKENTHTKLAVSSVSRQFREAMRPILFELVTVHSRASLSMLCRSVKESPSFAEGLMQHMRHLDIVYYSNQKSKYGKRKKADSDLEAIIRVCSRLTFLICLLHGSPRFGHRLFAKLSNLCPSVEVIFWSVNAQVKHSPFDLSLLVNLRVFYFDWNRYERLLPYRAMFPSLHTLSSPRGIYRPTDEDARIPSLRTLMITGEQDYHSPFSGSEHGTWIANN